MILILSADAVGAALLGALIETLGYDVRFSRPRESSDATFRRVRPRVTLIDCADPQLCNSEVIGHAAMRGISVVAFGSSEALDRVRVFVQANNIESLLVPPDTNVLANLLERALAKAG
jgi:DNA-binding NtrC family response regulator